MTAIAVERPRERRGARLLRSTGRGLLFVAVPLVLWALWEGYRCLWINRGWTWPFAVDHLGTLQVAAWFSVAVIAAYLTFFPVAISTLRGLQSADRQALELMRSYAAGRLTVLWKLRLPTALPYIFAALKVSATASIDRKSVV